MFGNSNNIEMGKGKPNWPNCFKVCGRECSFKLLVILFSDNIDQILKIRRGKAGSHFVFSLGGEYKQRMSGVKVANQSPHKAVVTYVVCVHLLIPDIPTLACINLSAPPSDTFLPPLGHCSLRKKQRGDCFISVNPFVLRLENIPLLPLCRFSKYLHIHCKHNAL